LKRSQAYFSWRPRLFHGICFDSFTVTAWTDGNQNGLPDAGEETETVNVHVVNSWTCNPQDGDGWTAPRAHVLAGADGVSLRDLAKQITNNADDARYLHGPTNIKRGDKIDVAPLLKAFEDRIRQDVVDAANYQNKRAGFPRSVKDSRSCDTVDEATVNSVFGIGPAPSPLPKYDCMSMVEIIFARAVIKESKPGEFNSLFHNPMQLWIKYLAQPRIVPLSSAAVKNGDFTYFMNNLNYMYVHDMSKSAYLMENVIVTGKNQYFGWNLGSKNYAQWLEALRVGYNQGLKPGAKPLPDVGGDLGKLQRLIPGYNIPATAGHAAIPGRVKFLDVPKIAMALFLHRTPLPD
jgi:hypothetical protein